MRTSSASAPSVRDGRTLVAAALGVCVGLSGIDHGIFEVLQGNTRTPGLLIDAIGPAQRMWEFGTETAFTVVPNFLVTGVLAIIVGVVTIVWSVRFLDRPRGSGGLLVLGLLTLAVGGGIGMLVFLFFGWAVARRIGQPGRRSSLVPERIRHAVSRARPWLVGLGLVQYVLAIWIAITGIVPGTSDPDSVFAVCWSFLAGALASFAVALVGTGVEAEDAQVPLSPVPVGHVSMSR